MLEKIHKNRLKHLFFFYFGLVLISPPNLFAEELVCDKNLKQARASLRSHFLSKGLYRRNFLAHQNSSYLNHYQFSFKKLAEFFDSREAWRQCLSDYGQPLETKDEFFNLLEMDSQRLPASSGSLLCNKDLIDSNISLGTFYIAKGNYQLNFLLKNSHSFLNQEEVPGRHYRQFEERLASWDICQAGNKQVTLPIESCDQQLNQARLELGNHLVSKGLNRRNYLSDSEQELTNRKESMLLQFEKFMVARESWRQCLGDIGYIHPKLQTTGSSEFGWVFSEDVTEVPPKSGPTVCQPHLENANNYLGTYYVSKGLYQRNFLVAGDPDFENREEIATRYKDSFINELKLWKQCVEDKHIVNQPDINFHLALQDNYSTLAEYTLGVKNNIWVISSWGLMDHGGLSFEEAAGASTEQIQNSLNNYLSRNTKLDPNTHDTIILDIENTIHPKLLGDLLESDTQKFKASVEALKKRISVARLTFPNAKLSLYGVVISNSTGWLEQPYHLIRMRGYIEAGKLGLYDQLDYLTPVIYPRFGPEERWFNTLRDYTAGSIIESRRLLRSDGTNLELLPLLTFIVINGSSTDNRNAVSPSTLTTQALVLKEMGVKNIVFYGGSGTEGGFANSEIPTLMEYFNQILFPN